MKIKYTIILVAVFLVILAFAMRSEEANADGPYIGLAVSVLNGDSSLGEIGYRYGRWDYQLGLYGAGDTRNGYQERTEMASVSRIVTPGWRVMGQRFFMRLGVAYVNQHKLVGGPNFRLGLGFMLGDWELEYQHYSSANINQVNTGIDAIGIRAKF